MHPFIRPGELEREATPPIKAHRRLANGTGEPMREYVAWPELVRFGARWFEPRKTMIGRLFVAPPE